MIKYKYAIAVGLTFLNFLMTATVGAQISSSSSGSSSSSTSSSSSSSSSSGGSGTTISRTTYICPEVSDVTVLGVTSSDPRDYQVDVHDQADSIVVYRHFVVEGGPALSQSTRIQYANGSGKTLTMSVTDSAMNVRAEIAFPPTASWNDWQTLSINRALSRSIYLIAQDEEGGPHLGSLTTSITINTSAPGGWGYGYSDPADCPTTEPELIPEMSCTVTDPAVWNGGFVLNNAVIKNESDQTITDWNASLTFDTAIEIDHAWNVETDVVEPSNTQVITTPVSWNQRLEPGQSVYFGFIGRRSGEIDAPFCAPQVLDFE